MIKTFQMKRCPFCGDRPSMDSFYMNQGYKWGGVECGCGARGPDVRTGYDESPDAPWRQRAIEEWNRRAPGRASAPESRTIHELKTDPEIFDAVAAGEKSFEIRFNDRNYRVGDILRLRKTRYTGAEMKAGKPLEYIGDPYDIEVTYILHGPVYGLAEDWVILSVTPVEIPPEMNASPTKQEQKICYQCEQPAPYLFEDGRCEKCTRALIEEDHW